MAARPDRCLGNFPLSPFSATRSSCPPCAITITTRLIPLSSALPPPLRPCRDSITGHHLLFPSTLFRQTKSWRAARRRAACSSSLFTMAMRYSHYPPVYFTFGPTQCIARDAMRCDAIRYGGGGGDNDEDDDDRLRERKRRTAHTDQRSLSWDVGFTISAHKIL